MKDFFLSYWREVLEVVVLLTTLILWIIRKKPVNIIDTCKELICLVLPAFIREAETLFTNGKEKLDFVIDKTVKFLQSSYPDIKMTSDVLKFIKDQVENILSTPVKKESEVFYAKIRK